MFSSTIQGQCLNDDRHSWHFSQPLITAIRHLALCSMDCGQENMQWNVSYSDQNKAYHSVCCYHWYYYLHCCVLCCSFNYYTPRTTKLLGGYTGFTPSVRPSVCPSVRPSVRPSRMPCPLCIIYSYGWILFILGTNDHYHERVCRAPWPLTLTYIFKVIWPWLRKSCPLCSVYSSGWILPIFGTNDNYH